MKTATDVTGFGLVGHLSNILNQSGLAAKITFESIPILDGALSMAADGIAPGGTRRNLVDVDGISWDGITEAEQLICADSQTSGGLLLAVAPDVAGQVIADLQAAGTLAAAHIGTLVDGPPGTIQLFFNGGVGAMIFSRTHFSITRSASASVSGLSASKSAPRLSEARSDAPAKPPSAPARDAPLTMVRNSRRFT